MGNMKKIGRAVILLAMMVVLFGMRNLVGEASKSDSKVKIDDVYLSDENALMSTDSDVRLQGKDVKIGETVYFTIKIMNTNGYDTVTVNVEKTEGLSLNTTDKSVRVTKSTSSGSTQLFSWVESENKTKYSLEISGDLLSEISDTKHITVCYPVVITKDIVLNQSVEQTISLGYVKGDTTESISYTPVDNKHAQVRVCGFTVIVTNQEEVGLPVDKAGFTLTEKGVEEGTTCLTDENGKIVFSGLKAGKEYALEQKERTEGYMLMTDAIKVKVNEDGKIFFDESTESADTLAIQLKKETIAMPNTGNCGTVIFSAVGCVLIAVAMVLSVVFKKQYYIK